MNGNLEISIVNKCYYLYISSSSFGLTANQYWKTLQLIILLVAIIAMWVVPSITYKKMIMVHGAGVIILQFPFIRMLVSVL